VPSIGWKPVKPAEDVRKARQEKDRHQTTKSTLSTAGATGTDLPSKKNDNGLDPRVIAVSV
jgi:hypothetical protein